MSVNISTGNVLHAHISSNKCIQRFHWCRKHFPISFSVVNIIRLENKYSFYARTKRTFHISFYTHGWRPSPVYVYYLCIIERHQISLLILYTFHKATSKLSLILYSCSVHPRGYRFGYIPSMRMWNVFIFLFEHK